MYLSVFRACRTESKARWCGTASCLILAFPVRVVYYLVSTCARACVSGVVPVCLCVCDCVPVLGIRSKCTTFYECWVEVFLVGSGVVVVVVVQGKDCMLINVA